ncbi:MAG TPA: DUF58 domain-containing protein [Actinomycetota bacterium]
MPRRRRAFRLRKRAAALMGGAVVLFLLGTNVQAGWLFVLSALLLGTVIAGAMLPGRMLRGIRIERRAPAEVHQGDEAYVELVVSNPTRRLRAGIVADDPMFSPASFEVGTLRPGERVELGAVRVAERRGPQEGGTVTLRSAAPFGVAERRRSAPAPAPCLVLPKVWPLGALAFVDAAATTERALHSAPRRGGGPEFLGVREYRSGDSMRHVHWPSTARTGTVMVREFEEERTRRIAIVVDTVADAGDAWTPLDACCAAAASIALAAAADGQGARLLVPGEHEVEVAAHEDGRALLRRLGRLAPSGRSLADAAPELADALRGAETVVAIAPTWRANAGPTLVPALVTLAASGARVVVIPVVLDPEAAGRFALPPAEADALVADLRRTGFATYPWRPGEELADALAGRAAAALDPAGVAP